MTVIFISPDFPGPNVQGFFTMKNSADDIKFIHYEFYIIYIILPVFHLAVLYARQRRDMGGGSEHYIKNVTSMQGCDVLIPFIALDMLLWGRLCAHPHFDH